MASTDTLNHPHDYHQELPERLAPEDLRPLYQIQAWRSVGAVATEWLSIAAAIALSYFYWHPLLYIATVIFIGARQHALLIIGHDASHYTLLPNKRWNDWFADLFLFWPTFSTVDGFRYFHGDHHRFLGTAQDKNRILWHTHNKDGELTTEWRYPKSVGELSLRILIRMAFFTGFFWILLGLLNIFLGKNALKQKSLASRLPRLLFYAVIFAFLTYAGLWWEFLLYWIIPFCTWHMAIEYIRLICEHSAVKGEAPYHLTRTTVPRFLEKMLIIPRNIGYHHEHHWYPAVPFYHLPKLHRLLTEKTGFGRYGNISSSVLTSLRQCTEQDPNAKLASG